MRGISLENSKRKRSLATGESWMRRDYHSYEWRRGERLRTGCLCAGITALLAYFFYRSAWAMIPLSAIGVVSWFRIREDRHRMECRELNTQFAECILAVSTMMKAGYSVENAFLEGEQDMVLLFGADSLIDRELKLIRRGLSINISLEELLSDLGKRSDCEDISGFAEVFSIAKRSGGNLSEIIRNTAELISRKNETQKEIDVMLGGKKMELGIMEIMPMGILFYLDIVNPGYFDLLYHNLKGVLMMTACLCVYLAAILVGDRILKRMSDRLR